jgi:putative ABC transport system permease protein
VRTLDKKLLRDLARMKGQVLTIALVVACGVAALVAALSTYDSLRLSQQTYYEQSHFADVFASLKRAPAALQPKLAAIPGVAEVELRIVFDATLDVPRVSAPPVGRMISLPPGGQPQLNRLHLRLGRWPDPDKLDEALLSEGFAQASGLAPGASLRALINGKYEVLHVVGIALSPEYVYSIRSGDPLPDDRQFGILWVAHDALAAAFNMEGAFNDVAVRLAPGASQERVIQALDQLLLPYGSLGAYGRAEQLSNRFVQDEIEQQRMMATTIPPVFLAVAAFLLNVVLGRVIAAQREQIAALKALGLDNREVAVHYLKFVSLITLAGIAGGAMLGIWLGKLMTANYVLFFRLPLMQFRIQLWVLALAGGVTLAAAVLAALSAVRGVVRLAPAEAMRPPAPRAYKRSFIERLWAAHWLSPQGRMVARNIVGRPFRALFTCAGIALALPITVLGLFWMDAIDYMIAVQFGLIDRGDALVSFTEPVDGRAVRELARVAGVRAVEGMRAVPVRLRVGHRDYRTGLLGLSPEGELRRLLDANLEPIPLPAQGVLLTDRLGERLGARAGDSVRIEVLEGERVQREVPVAGLVNELVGMSAYMDVRALRRLLREGDAVSAAALSLEPSRADETYAQLKQFPKVSTVSVKTIALQSFLDTTASFVLVFTGILTAFAIVIAVGIVYNSARIALAERAWELASLRVLGFTRGEVSRILLAELAVEVLLAIPVGLWLAHQCVETLVEMHATEMFRIPAVVEPRSYALATLAVVAAAALSAAVVRHRIDHLDLVSVLKTRE